jgi:hypothetical protein
MLAPYGTGDSMLLDAKTLVQSESGSFMKAFAELPSVIPKQMGGSRSRNRRKSRKNQQRGGMQEFNGANGAFSTPMGVGMGMGLGSGSGSGSGSQQGGRRRKQRGGSAPFESAFATPRPSAETGQNPQFYTESDMGYGFSAFKGAQ